MVRIEERLVQLDVDLLAVIPLRHEAYHAEPLYLKGLAIVDLLVAVSVQKYNYGKFRFRFY